MKNERQELMEERIIREEENYIEVEKELVAGSPLFERRYENGFIRFLVHDDVVDEDEDEWDDKSMFIGGIAGILKYPMDILEMVEVHVYKDKRGNGYAREMMDELFSDYEDRLIVTRARVFYSEYPEELDYKSPEFKDALIFAMDFVKHQNEFENINDLSGFETSQPYAYVGNNMGKVFMEIIDEL